MTVLVTGGAGFIGSNFILDWFAHSDETLVNLDKLTYSGNLASIDGLKGNPAHIFVHGDIGDRGLVRELLERHAPRAIVHLAAESHVDRSIRGPADFIQTNVVGTFSLLEEVRAWWQRRAREKREAFRFLHVSTDEVYGSLGLRDPAFTESTPYAPNSPYAASKAASDHLVRAYHHTYGLPTLTSNCSNNYGPRQFPEKLIPLIIFNAVAGKPLPVYGDGENVRDWLYVRDHCDALRLVLDKGIPGSVYNIGGSNEQTNIAVVIGICSLLDKLKPREAGRYEELVEFVRDRPGHDRRYAIDSGMVARELGWKPKENFASGLKRTVTWYLDNRAWIESVQSGEHRRWLELNYASR
jgi:dTDP-glucose 4,6-dehydratase